MTSVGNIIVHRGMPPAQPDGKPNPYLGTGCNHGELRTVVYPYDRVLALVAFCEGKPTDSFTFWHVPNSGGARQIISRDEVKWDDDFVAVTKSRYPYLFRRS